MQHVFSTLPFKGYTPKNPALRPVWEAFFASSGNQFADIISNFFQGWSLGLSDKPPPNIKSVNRTNSILQSVHSRKLILDMYFENQLIGPFTPQQAEDLGFHVNMWFVVEKGSSTPNNPSFRLVINFSDKRFVTDVNTFISDFFAHVKYI